MDTGFSVATLQDSASALYRNNITPLLQRCASYIGEPRQEMLLSEEAKRALQHAEGLKWQQDMFHRLLNLVCLLKEGLASEDEVNSCRIQILIFLKSPHPDGEWAEFTRDKLLFLQDLLFAACISEGDYHATMKPLLLRLAEQGAIIDAQDFILNSSNSTSGKARDTKVKTKVGLSRAPSTTPRRRAKARSMADSDGLLMSPAAKSGKREVEESSKSSSSPLKQVMSKLSKTPNSSSKSIEEKDTTACRRVPHALDFLRPEHCPMREPPSPQLTNPSCQKSLDFSSISITEQKQDAGSASPCPVSADSSTYNLLNSPLASPAKVIAEPSCDSPHKASLEPFSLNDRSNRPAPLLERNSSGRSPAKTPSRLRSIFTGFIQRKAISPSVDDENFLSSNESDSDCQIEKLTANKGKWGLEFLKFPKKPQNGPDQGQPPNDQEDSTQWPANLNMDNTSSLLTLPVDAAKGQGPNTKRLKKKVHSQGAPTDFFIDKVLGENIKNELSRIRAEMNKTQSGQIFTNEQIDAIATRLPVDKSELKKFFPQTWCDRYGDIVLEVVRKEFKEHVGEMQKMGTEGRQKNHAVPVAPNDENMVVHDHHHYDSQKGSSPYSNTRRAPEFSKCFTTLDENTCKGFSPAAPLSPSTCEAQSQASIGKTKTSSKFTRKHGGHLRTEMDLSQDLDLQLEEELSKMPLRKFNEYGSHLRA